MFVFHPYVEHVFIEKDLYLVDYYYGMVNKLSNIPFIDTKNINDLISVLDQDIINTLLDSGMVVNNQDFDFSSMSLQDLQDDFFAQKDVLHVILLPTENCNFRCSYCFETFNSLRMQSDTIEAVKKYIKNDIEQYDAVFVEWFGGEPLLEIPTIIDICSFTKALCEKTNKNFYSHITTNGYLLTSEVATELISVGVNSFTVTLDGNEHTHNQTRVLCNGNGTFNTILKNIISLSESNLDFKFKFRCNLTSENVASVNGLVEVISSIAKNDHRMNDINIRAVFNYDGKTDNDMVLDRNAALKHTYDLLTKCLKLGLHDKSTIFNFELGGCVCYAGEPDTFVIGADGTLMKCSLELRNNPKNIVGKILPDGRLEVDDELNNMWCNTECQLPSKCHNCPRLATCMGNACPKARLTEDKVACPDALEKLSETIKLLSAFEADSDN